MTYEKVIRMNSYEGFAMPTIFHRENIKASGVINFASLAGVVGMPGYLPLTRGRCTPAVARGRCP